MLSRTLYIFPLFPVRLFVRLLIGISTLYGFFALKNMYGYKPFPLGTLKALEMTLLAHLGLWLATLEMRSRWRFLIAVLLILSAMGVYFLLWHWSVFTVIVAPIALSWLLYKVLQGKPLDA